MGNKRMWTSQDLHRLVQHPQDIVPEVRQALQDGDYAYAVGLLKDLSDLLNNSRADVAPLLDWFLTTPIEQVGDLDLAEVLSFVGRMVSRRGDQTRAEQLFKRMLDLGETVNSVEIKRRALQSLGVTKKHQGLLDEAEDYYLGALQLARTAGDVYGEAQLLNNIGSLAAETKRPEEAERLLRLSIDIRTLNGWIVEAAGTAVSLSGVLAGQGRFEEAQHLLEGAIVVAKEHQHLDILALGYCNLGSVAVDRGELKRARSLFASAIRYAQAIGDLHAEALGYQGRAIALHRLGSFRRAAQAFAHLTGLKHLLGDERGSALAQHDRASMLLMDNDKQAGAKEYLTAASRFRALGDWHWYGMSLLGVAKASPPQEGVSFLNTLLYDVLPQLLDGNFPIEDVVDTAIMLRNSELANKALDIEDQVRKTAGQRSQAVNDAWRWFEVAITAGSRRLFPLAHSLFRRAFSVYSAVLEPEVLADLQIEVGNLLANEGNLVEAIKLFRHIRDRALKWDNRVLEALAAHNLGELYRRSGQYKHAKSFLTEALEAAESLGDTQGQLDSLNSLALLHSNRNEPKKAASLYARYEAVLGSSPDRRNRARLLMGKGHVAFASNTFDTAAQLYLEAAELFEKDGSLSHQIDALYNAGLATTKAGRKEDGLQLLNQSAQLGVDTGNVDAAIRALELAADEALASDDVGQAAKCLVYGVMSSLSNEDSSDTKLFSKAIAIYGRFYKELGGSETVKGRDLSAQFKAVLHGQGLGAIADMMPEFERSVETLPTRE